MKLLFNNSRKNVTDRTHYKSVMRSAVGWKYWQFCTRSIDLHKYCDGNEEVTHMRNLEIKQYPADHTRPTGRRLMKSYGVEWLLLLAEDQPGLMLT